MQSLRLNKRSSIIGPRMVSFSRKRNFDWLPIGCGCGIFLFFGCIALTYWGTIIYIVQHFVRKLW